MHILHKKLITICLCLALSCTVLSKDNAHAGAFEEPQSQKSSTHTIPDPYESINRHMFHFNDILDKIILKPTAQLYNAAIPTFGKIAINNVLANIHTPVTVGNQILQGKTNKAVKTTWRFIINTSLGLGGILDVATPAGLPKPSREDFGQTLAIHNVNSGPYLVLPLLGPTSTRDGLSRIVDVFLNPFNFILHDKIAIARVAVQQVHNRSKSLKLTDQVEETSFDPYASVRSLFIQFRHNLISQ